MGKIKHLTSEQIDEIKERAGSGNVIFRSATVLALLVENERLAEELQNQAIVATRDGVAAITWYGKYKVLHAENERLRGALDDAGNAIARVVACCTYGSEEQAKVGAYGISHEAFTEIDAFIRKHGDLLNALKGGEE